MTGPTMTLTQRYATPTLMAQSLRATTATTLDHQTATMTIPRGPVPMQAASGLRDKPPALTKAIGLLDTRTPLHLTTHPTLAPSK